MLAPSEDVALPGVGDSDGGISMLPNCICLVVWSRCGSIVH
jgi:hypothetical protein